MQILPLLSGLAAKAQILKYHFSVYLATLDKFLNGENPSEANFRTNSHPRYFAREHSRNVGTSLLRTKAQTPNLALILSLARNPFVKFIFHWV